MQNGQPASRGVSFAFLCHVAHFGVTFMALHSIFRSSSSTNSHSPGHTGGGYLHLGTQCQRNRSHRLTISEHFIEQSQHNFLFYCTRSLPLFFFYYFCLPLLRRKCLRGLSRRNSQIKNRMQNIIFNLR